MPRQRVAAARLRSHESLLYRTNVHVRAVGNGVLSALVLTSAAAISALMIWPTRADTFGLADFIEGLRGAGLEDLARPVLPIASTFAIVSLGFTAYRLRRWRLEKRLGHLSASISNTDPRMAAPTRDPHRIAAGLAAPVIEWIETSQRGKLALRRLTPTTNILGAPRMEIAYLRLFDNQHRQVSFVHAAWREYGTVNMLRGAHSMTVAEARRGSRYGLESLFVTNRDQLESELASIGTVPQFGFHRVQAGPTRIFVRDRYGAYPMRSILCANATWRAAVDRLLDTADLAVVDLSGYTDRRLGTRYEIQRVLDRVPAERLLFLAGPESNGKHLESAIADAWLQLYVDSPNAATPHQPLLIARVDRLVKTTDRETNSTTVEIETSRKETRRLIAGILFRLHGARSILPQSALAEPIAGFDGVDPWTEFAEPDQSRGVNLSPGPTVIDPTVAEIGLSSTAADEGPLAPVNERLGTSRRRRQRAWVPIACVAAVAVGGGVAALIASVAGQGDDGAEPATERSIDPGTCERYVVQLGAFPTESGVRRRVSEVGAMLDRAAISMTTGWLHDASCGYSSRRPDQYFALAGPFGTIDEAEHACRQVRALQVAQGQSDLAGYRSLAGAFKQCI